MDIVPERPRTVEDALEIVKAAKPDHVLIIWAGDDDGSETLNIMTACNDGDELTGAQVVWLCERAKVAQLGGLLERVGPVRTFQA